MSAKTENGRTVLAEQTGEFVQVVFHTACLPSYAPMENRAAWLQSTKYIPEEGLCANNYTPRVLKGRNENHPGPGPGELGPAETRKLGRNQEGI